MDLQPIKEHTTSQDVHIMYREMVERNRKDRKKIRSIISKRKARQEKEEEIRGVWDRLTEEEKFARIAKLEELCNELIEHHPDYKYFNRAKVTITDDVCKINWNGKKHNEVTGWNIVDREFPVNEIPLVIKRLNDRLLLKIKEEEL